MRHAPIDRLQQIIAQSWLIGGLCTSDTDQSDHVPTATTLRSRAVMVEHIADLTKDRPDMANGSIAVPSNRNGFAKASAASAAVVYGEAIGRGTYRASLAYVRFGADPSISASNADMPVMANARMMLAVNSLVRYAAAVLAAGSGTLLFTRGDGSYV
jgi:hypothetical protein